ncbi:MAG: alpha-2-macroglobulin, partial [Alphaproteobacteria bacterium]
AHYLGRRALAVAQRDLYGRLIDPTGERVGVIRSGGDDPFALQDQALPERSTETVSLYSGIVAVDDQGTASIPLELPDFNGQLRLMAVAWSGGRIGKARSRLVVRAPVIAGMTLPRFLAPDDEAASLIVLRNLDGAPGDYRVELAVDGPLEIGESSIEIAALEAGEERRVRRVLRATGVGVAEITMTVEGPDGFATERVRTISVRPASPFVTERLTASLAPGQSLELGPDIATGFRPETVSAALSIGTLPQLDVAGLLLALDRYPYGCVEQITSRALPLLYVNALGRGLGLREDRELSRRIDRAISRLAAYQAHNGGFSLWGGGSGRAWLTAYVTEFLLRAADAGFDVPEQVLSSALAWLENYALNTDFIRYALVSKAYAHYVLALGGVGSLSELRYFADRYESRLTVVGRAHLAAAFSMHGDPARARATYAGIPATHPGLQLVSGSDYGSPLRDLAAVVALGAEGGIVPHEDLVRPLARLSATMQQKRYLSTQDMAWLVRAAHAVS